MVSDEQLKEEFEERAAIKQFDGKMKQEEAEYWAWKDTYERING